MARISIISVLAAAFTIICLLCGCTGGEGSYISETGGSYADEGYIRHEDEHREDFDYGVEVCNIEGEHTHDEEHHDDFDCGIEGCTIEGEHTHDEEHHEEKHHEDEHH